MLDRKQKERYTTHAAPYVLSFLDYRAAPLIVLHRHWFGGGSQVFASPTEISSVPRIPAPD